MGDPRLKFLDLLSDAGAHVGDGELHLISLVLHDLEIVLALLEFIGFLLEGLLDFADTCHNGFELLGHLR